MRRKMERGGGGYRAAERQAATREHTVGSKAMSALIDTAVFPQLHLDSDDSAIRGPWPRRPSPTSRPLGGPFCTPTERGTTGG